MESSKNSTGKWNKTVLGGCGMKIKNIISFAKESISRNLKQFLLLDLLSLLGFLILGIIMLLVLLLSQGELEVNEVLQNRLNRAGSIVLTESQGRNSKTNPNIYEELKNINGIENLFWFSEPDYFITNNVAELKNIKIKSSQEDSENSLFSQMEAESGMTSGKMLPCANTTLNGVEAMGIPLKNGSMEEIKSQKKEDEKIILLGADYDSSLIGKRFSVLNTNYYIAGQLEKGAKILSTRLDIASDSTSKYTQVLDSYLLLCSNDTESPLGSNYTFIWKEGTDYGHVRNDIQKVANKYHVPLGTTKMKSVIKENNQVFQTIKDSFVLLFFVLSISTFFIFCSNQFINIMNRKSEYGILYACGCTTRDLTRMQMMEVVFINSMAYLAAIALLVVGMRLTIAYNVNLLNQSIYFVKKYVWWMVLLFATFFTFASLILPIRYIKKMRPVELIGGNET